MQDISLFFGRFHPLIVHLPIGIILFAFALQVYERFSQVKYKQAIVLAYVLTAISGGLAALVGYLLSTSGGYDDATLSWHKWLGIVTSLLAMILAVIKSSDSFDLTIGKFTLSQIGLVVTVVLISITGHLGGNLTHGASYLTEYMPPQIKQIFAVERNQKETTIFPTVIDSINMYTHIIQPVLEAKCQSCHNPSKMKGELDLTSIEGIEQGGLSGHAIEGGKLNKSELFKRVTLSRDSKKFMPPDNKPAMTNVEVDLLKMWVKNGASFERKFHEENPDEKEVYLVSVYLGFSAQEKDKAQLPIVTEIDEQLLEELKADGLLIDFIEESSTLIDVSFINIDRERVTNVLNKLAGLQNNIYKLNLANCELKDDDLAPLKSMDNLHFLRLENNQISGSSLSNLASLQNLNYLNLNGNPLSEVAEQGLDKLSFIDKIYLWQTPFDTSSPKQKIQL